MPHKLSSIIRSNQAYELYSSTRTFIIQLLIHIFLVSQRSEKYILMFVFTTRKVLFSLNKQNMLGFPFIYVHILVPGGGQKMDKYQRVNGSALALLLLFLCYQTVGVSAIHGTGRYPMTVSTLIFLSSVLVRGLLFDSFFQGFFPLTVICIFLLLLKFFLFVFSFFLFRVPLYTPFRFFSVAFRVLFYLFLLL